MADNTGSMSPRSEGYKEKTKSSVTFYATNTDAIDYAVLGK